MVPTIVRLMTPILRFGQLRPVCRRTCLNQLRSRHADCFLACAFWRAGLAIVGRNALILYITYRLFREWAEKSAKLQGVAAELPHAAAVVRSRLLVAAIFWLLCFWLSSPPNFRQGVAMIPNIPSTAGLSFCRRMVVSPSSLSVQ